MTEEKKGLFDSLKDIYVKKYKLLMIIPFLLLVLAFAQIIGQYAVTGDFVNRGISLLGRTSVLKYLPLEKPKIMPLVK